MRGKGAYFPAEMLVNITEVSKLWYCWVWCSCWVFPVQKSWACIANQTQSGQIFIRPSLGLIIFSFLWAEYLWFLVAAIPLQGHWVNPHSALHSNTSEECSVFLKLSTEWRMNTNHCSWQESKKLPLKAFRADSLECFVHALTFLS